MIPCPFWLHISRDPLADFKRVHPPPPSPRRHARWSNERLRCRVRRSAAGERKVRGDTPRTKSSAKGESVDRASQPLTLSRFLRRLARASVIALCTSDQARRAAGILPGASEASPRNETLPPGSPEGATGRSAANTIPSPRRGSKEGEASIRGLALRAAPPAKSRRPFGPDRTPRPLRYLSPMV
jgi:hypothetical protein